ncbi:hypothetical protein JTB14_014157 [Gonioctena quinquepunctata]|nr:hypothetical protein JTB14_014157 [Gonioctena quinquepunctata]
MTRYLTDAELEDIMNNQSDSSDNEAPLQTEFQESDKSEHDDDDGDDQLSEDEKAYFYGKKNRYKWSKSPPASTRSKAENIILQLPWLNGPAANNLPTTPYGAWSLLVTDNILDIIVEHTNRKITDESHKYGDRLNRNETFSSLASEYGVGRSTIYDVKKKHEKIKKFVSTTDCGPGKRQTLKKAEHPEVEEALYMWFLQERNRHAPISGPMLAMKAKFFYKEITKKDDFVASKGWLERFKSRHGIRLMTITGEKLSNDATCIEPFKLRFCKR